MMDTTQISPAPDKPKWWEKLLSALLIVVILVIIGAIIYIANDTSAGEKFSEFYLLGPGGKAENYPKDITLGQGQPVIQGLVNRERQPTGYRFDMLVDKATIYSREAINLKNDEKWEGKSPSNPGRQGKTRRWSFTSIRTMCPRPTLSCTFL